MLILFYATGRYAATRHTVLFAATARTTAYFYARHALLLPLRATPALLPLCHHIASFTTLNMIRRCAC